jgi:hypothetical protein
MKTKVLFVTQTLGAKAACGIGLMGDVTGKVLLQHPELHFDMIYTDSLHETQQRILSFDPQVVIYNYAPGTTPWIDDYQMRAPFPYIKHARIMHDMNQSIADSFRPETNHGWQYIIADDPSVKETKHVFTTNRLLPGNPTVSYVEPKKPIIGFQGFGPPHKGIARLAHKVQEEFDEATLRLHIPFGFYEDLIHGYKGSNAYARANEVKQIITKPGIDVIITHDLLDTQGIIDLLAQNTINCYFYDYLDGAGLASSPDYALAAKRPIAVTRSYQMRNYWDLEPSVLIENSSIKQIIANGTAPLEPLYKAYSKESVWQDYTRVVNAILTSA